MPIVESLKLPRCPHCRVDTPYLSLVAPRFSINDSEGRNPREWGIYRCARCGGVVTAWAPTDPKYTREPLGWFPGEKELDKAISERARAYLDQAISTIHAPAPSVMAAASSVDAMLTHLSLLEKVGLKVKKYRDGSLKVRIDQAAMDHLITAEMAEWAHEIRLDANDQRHADKEAPLPEVADTGKAIEFARALAQFLFVLPARVQRGRGKDITTPTAAES